MLIISSDCADLIRAQNKGSLLLGDELEFDGLGNVISKQPDKGLACICSVDSDFKLRLELIVPLAPR